MPPRHDVDTDARRKDAARQKIETCLGGSWVQELQGDHEPQNWGTNTLEYFAKLAQLAKNNNHDIAHLNELICDVLSRERAVQMSGSLMKKICDEYADQNNIQKPPRKRRATAHLSTSIANEDQTLPRRRKSARSRPSSMEPSMTESSQPRGPRISLSIPICSTSSATLPEVIIEAAYNEAREVLMKYESSVSAALHNIEEELESKKSLLVQDSTTLEKDRGELRSLSEEEVGIGVDLQTSLADATKKADEKREAVEALRAVEQLKLSFQAEFEDLLQREVQELQAAEHKVAQLQDQVTAAVQITEKRLAVAAKVAAAEQTLAAATLSMRKVEAQLKRASSVVKKFQGDFQPFTQSPRLKTPLEEEAAHENSEPDSEMEIVVA